MARRKATRLVELLEETRPAVEAALAEAERELDELNARRSELEAVIARARAVLGDGPSLNLHFHASSGRPASDAPDAGVRLPGKRMTLHEAMALVLRENGNSWMSVHDLASQINERALYEKRDKSLVDPTQIHARASKYPDWFEKLESDRSQLRLKAG